MLDVDGRDHVDARVEHFLDVLPALLVPHARRVRVRELVDERELRRAPDHGIHVHLRELHRAPLRVQPRHDFEPLGQRGGLRAVVGLEVADHDVDALLLGLPALLEHAVGLAHASNT